MKNVEITLPSYQLFSLTNCNLCGAAERDILFSVSDALIPVTAVLCRQCGLIYLKEALPEEAAREFYTGDNWRSIVYSQETNDTLLEKLFQDQVSRAKLALDFIESTTGNISGKRCLDIGSGTGGFVYVLRDRGATAVGVEPSTSHSEYSIKRQTLDVICDSFENLAIEAEYNLILCTRTLNHLLDPSQAISKMRKMLAPAGFIYLEVLNFPHAIRRKSLSQCVKIDHPYMFSVNTLSGLLEKCGFEIIAFDDDLNGRHEFGSLNHIHGVAQVAPLPQSFLPPPLAALEVKLDCALAMAQYLSIANRPVLE